MCLFKSFTPYPQARRFFNPFLTMLFCIKLPMIVRKSILLFTAVNGNKTYLRCLQHNAAAIRAIILPRIETRPAARAWNTLEV